MITAATDFLTRDVSFLGGLQSPMLSWLGSAGLLVFFAWQLARLLVGAARAALPFVRLRPALAAFAERVEVSDLGQAYDRAFYGRAEPPRRGESAGTGSMDVDELTGLDRTMCEVPAFRRPWIQYRKTLLFERVPWFREPRIYSTRRAEEFFTQDAVLAGRVDLGFFGQVPSLITGLGLLLTFVAICVGLSRLHAEGQSITGIQGLINGLAGKFLTSIVGLVCANLFLLLERPAVRRLQGLHAEFLALLDESFPRRTVEELLDTLARHRPARETSTAEPRAADGDRAADGVPEQLSASIDELTAVVRALAERLAEPGDATRTVAASIQALEAGQERTRAQMGAVVERLGTLTSALASRGATPAGRLEPRGAVLPGPGARDEDVRPPAVRRAWDWARPRRLRLG